MSTEEKKRDLAALALSTNSGLAGRHRVRSVTNLQYNVHVYDMGISGKGAIVSYMYMYKLETQIVTCYRGFLGTFYWVDVSTLSADGRRGDIALEMTRIVQILPSQCDLLG